MQVNRKPSRTTCKLSQDVCDALVRTHVPEITDDYEGDDIEKVIDAYAGFLTAVSNYTVRLNASVVSASLQTVHQCSPKVGTAFGRGMSKCMSHILRKMNEATTQKKLTAPVRSIIHIWNCSQGGRRSSGSDVMLPCEADTPSHASAPASPDTTKKGVVVSPGAIARLYGAKAIAKAPANADPQLAQQRDEVLLVDSSQEDCS